MGLARHPVPRRALLRYAAPLAWITLVGAPVAYFVATRDEELVARGAERLYAISLPDADGHMQSLAQWRGKYLVVNFWATWCAPCVKEMPELDRLQRRYADRKVAILGIGIETPERVRQFRDRLGLQMTLLAGEYDAMSIARAFGDEQGVLPYTVLLSTKGQLLRCRVGALEPGELERWLAAVP